MKMFHEYNGAGGIWIETARLWLVPLDAQNLSLWCRDMPALEKKWNVIYDAEPMEGIFADIVAGQLAATEKDPGNAAFHSFWFLIRRDDRKVIGSADFKDVPDERGEVEIGYGLGKAYEHQGYMTEAVRAMCEWAFAQSGVRAVIAETEPDGIGSQKLLKNCGFHEYKRGETLWFRLYPKPDFRFATEADAPLILRYIKELADYEGLLSEVVADEKTLREWVFGKQKAEVLFALADGKEVGFALFFHNFSTFLGRAGLYLEDLYVTPEYRGRGYGKAILAKLASIACERGCGRLEWWCLDSNKPGIDFYLSLGAEPMKDWTVYRIAGKTLQELAGE